MLDGPTTYKQTHYQLTDHKNIVFGFEGASIEQSLNILLFGYLPLIIKNTR